jgi:hypothetical protein
MNQTQIEKAIQALKQGLVHRFGCTKISKGNASLYE